MFSATAMIVILCGLGLIGVRFGLHSVIRARSVVPEAEIPPDLASFPRLRPLRSGV